jgi:hypothetical protein
VVLGEAALDIRTGRVTANTRAGAELALRMAVHCFWPFCVHLCLMLCECVAAVCRCAC